VDTTSAKRATGDTNKTLQARRAGGAYAACRRRNAIPVGTSHEHHRRAGLRFAGQAIPAHTHAPSLPTPPTFWLCTPATPSLRWSHVALCVPRAPHVPPTCLPRASPGPHLQVGVSVSFLAKLLARLGPLVPRTATTGEVVTQWLLPPTRAAQCR
jgi:hypothetical protein